MNANIAILGGGNLGMSIARGIKHSGKLPVSNVTLTRRRAHLLEEFTNEGFRASASNLSAVEQSEIIIIAVKPHQIARLLEEIKPSIRPGHHIIVSVVTGISIAEIAETLPNISVFRAMPNTAIALCESMTCISNASAPESDEQRVLELFNYLGKALLINEEHMGAATVLCACGIAFALRFMRAVMQGGIEIGFNSELSQEMTAQTLKGAAQLILKSGNHPEREIDKVTTPQGITISGLNEMEHQGFSSALIKGLLTSFNKLDQVKTSKKTTRLPA